MSKSKSIRLHLVFPDGSGGMLAEGLRNPANARWWAGWNAPVFRGDRLLIERDGKPLQWGTILDHGELPLPTTVIRWDKPLW